MADEIKVSRHAGQHIIKIMCNTANQRADPLHFLCLQQLCFGLALLGNIMGNRQHAYLPLEQNHTHVGFNRISAAVVADMHALNDCRALLLQTLHIFVKALYRHALHNIGHCYGKHLFTTVTQRATSRCIDIQKTTMFRIEYKNSIHGLINQRAILRFTFQPLAGALINALIQRGIKHFQFGNDVDIVHCQHQRF